MRIQLINPRDLSYKPRKGAFARSVSYPALTLTTLAALVPEELGAEVDILDEGVDERPIDPTADVIAITATTAGINRAYAIADQAHAAGAHVVMGGYHVSYRPEEAAAHADTVIVGPAEETWPRFLGDFAKGEAKKRYVQKGSPSLDGRPMPRRDLLKLGAYMKVTALMATRGCPNRCGFCIPSHYTGGRVRVRPVGDVVEEIKAGGRRTVLFLDSNIVADEEYACELMEALVPLKIRWGCLAPISVGRNPRVLELMERSGCMGALVGFESVCQRSLEGVSKGHNVVGRYPELVRGFHDHGLGIFGCFVFGFDDDGPDVFDKTLDFVRTSKIDLVRFAVLTPFPGTPLYESLDREGRIIERNLDLYDFQHVVHRPLGMSPEQLYDGLVRAWKGAYSMRNVLSRAVGAKASKPLILTANLAFIRYYKRLLAAGA